MNNLAVAYSKVGRLGDALPLDEETLKRRRAKLGPDHPDTLISMNNLARTYLAARRAEAEPLLRQALAIREKKLPDDWLTFETRSLLGGILLDRKNYAEAEPLLVSGFEGLKARASKIPAPAKNRVAEAGAGRRALHGLGQGRQGGRVAGEALPGSQTGRAWPVTESKDRLTRFPRVDTRCVAAYAGLPRTPDSRPSRSETLIAG